MRNIQTKRIASSPSPDPCGGQVVVYTERQDDIIRIVSARKATKTEIELFRKHQGGINE